MKMLLVTIAIITCMQLEPLTVFDFSKNSNLDSWYIMDDVVMGGRSDGHMVINKEGNASFYGNVSLENNGGFSSVRYQVGQKKITGYKECKLRLKGDGKRYQFRVKANTADRFSYITHFETSGEWETLSINLEDMYPSFRGRKLDMDNYAAEQLGEVAFLISNKVKEEFQLELDWMILE